MNSYEITITEILQKTVKLDAKSRQDAELQAEKNWKAGEYVLDADSFVEVRFNSRVQEKRPVYER